MEANQRLPAWFTPEHQKKILDLYRESGGRCVVTHKPCAGKWDINFRTVTTCRWGASCNAPLEPGEMCGRLHKEDPSRPEVPCETVTVGESRWRCAYGDYPCYSAVIIPDDVFPGRKFVIGELVFAFPDEFKEMLPGVRTTDYLRILAKDWRALHADLKRAEQVQEERQMHAGTPATERQLGRFSDIAREIFHEEQPGFYIKSPRIYDTEEKKIIQAGIAPVAGQKWKPVAVVEIPSSSTYDQEKKKWVPVTINVDISPAMKNISKAARNKAIRYGKPLPGPNMFEVEKIVADAVMEYQRTGKEPEIK